MATYAVARVIGSVATEEGFFASEEAFLSGYFDLVYNVFVDAAGHRIPADKEVIGSKRQSKVVEFYPSKKQKHSHGDPPIGSNPHPPVTGSPPDEDMPEDDLPSEMSDNRIKVIKDSIRMRTPVKSTGAPFYLTSYMAGLFDSTQAEQLPKMMLGIGLKSQWVTPTALGANAPNNFQSHKDYFSLNPGGGLTAGGIYGDITDPLDAIQVLEYVHLDFEIMNTANRPAWFDMDILTARDTTANSPIVEWNSALQDEALGITGITFPVDNLNPTPTFGSAYSTVPGQKFSYAAKANKIYSQVKHYPMLFGSGETINMRIGLAVNQIVDNATVKDLAEEYIKGCLLVMGTARGSVAKSTVAPAMALTGQSHFIWKCAARMKFRNVDRPISHHRTSNIEYKLPATATAAEQSHMDTDANASSTLLNAA